MGMIPTMPAGEDSVPITRPDVGEAEVAAVARVLRSGWLAQGPEVEAFEHELAEVVGAREAIAVASGSVALELALRALGIGPGDEVVTVSHSFVATANAVLAVGARPVFVDVEPDTLGMSAERAAAALGPRTRALLCVHQLGIPCDLPGVLALGASRGIPVVEDAACALGSAVRLGEGWRPLGAPAGLVACFSFHPRKLLTTGEGGMLTTGDAELARRLRRLRQHGVQGADPVHLEPGFNHRMSDMQAAIGRTQLARLDAALQRRRALAARLTRALADHPRLAAPEPRADARWNWQSYPARLRRGGEAERDALLVALRERGVSARPGVTNAHQEPAYSERPELWAAGPGGLAVSESLRATTLLLPLFQAMTEAEVDRVEGALAALAS